MEKGESNYLITIPQRGLKIIPPEETQKKMQMAKQGIKVEPYSEEEKYRLKKMINCRILKRRYPTKEDGQAFMKDVDLEWRDQLLDMAYELTETIVQSWRKINTNSDIAVLLYGSVAKGLTKKPTHEDPSNIDMAVIGNIGDCERLDLYDAIRPKRQEIQQRILAKCPVVNSDEINPGNAGVTIQDLSRIRNNYYYGVRSYIAAGAKTLYDESGIWRNIEMEAIAFARENTTPRGKKL